MAAVREVETLVADREVGDAFAAHGERQRQPVVEARVLDVDGGDVAPSSLAFGLVEGWRGETCHVLLTDAEGRIAAARIKDPSLHNWLALALAVRGEGISDFPICNKSFNLSYCGHDL
jgi:Ni,Fe-hydrogenase III large subunit